MEIVKFVRARCIYSTHSDFHVGERYRFNYESSGTWNRYFMAYDDSIVVNPMESRLFYIESAKRVIAVFEVVG